MAAGEEKQLWRLTNARIKAKLLCTAVLVPCVHPRVKTGTALNNSSSRPVFTAVKNKQPHKSSWISYYHTSCTPHLLRYISVPSEVVTIETSVRYIAGLSIIENGAHDVKVTTVFPLREFFSFHSERRGVCITDNRVSQPCYRAP